VKAVAVHCAALLLAVALVAGPVEAAGSLPLGFTDQLVALIPSPTGLAATPDGRILVTSQFGRLRVIKNGQLLVTPALDISYKVCSNSERGLQSVAVDPSFATNHFIYLFYTYAKTAGCAIANKPKAPVNRVSRFVLSDLDSVNPASEVLLLDNIMSFQGNHNGGDVQFGKDGLLYVSVGDGGCDYAQDSGCAGSNDAARDQHNLLGKIVRITRDGAVPPGNPYMGALSQRCNVKGNTVPGLTCQETFARGLRNPFRLAFDPNASGTVFYINDVGQDRWEEIDLGQAGVDYGWNVREGHCATGSTTNCGPPPAGMTNPIFDYPHTGCNAITGGAFVPNGSGWPPSYTGSYLFGDYTCGEIFRLDRQGSTYVRTPFASGLGGGGPVHMAFLPAPGGIALYYTTYDGGGEVHRIAFTSDGTPVAAITGSPDNGAAPLSVTFDGSGSRDPNESSLVYHWNFGDGGTATTGGPTASHTYTSNGTFSAALRVEDPGGLISPPAAMTITVGNTRPVPSIQSPAAGSLFSAGQTLTLSGTATDAEEGTLPASRLSWTVLRRHADHTHPWFGPASGNNLTFTAPDPEDLSAASNSYLEIYLTATDSGGLTRTVSMNLQPHKVLLTFTSSPTGAQLVIQGANLIAPVTITSWERWPVSVNAPNKTGWVFVSWSDGGARSHTIITPPTAATYNARYVKVPG
jgi:glucose/arabinose dehydrogenase/PKD repeat protein